MVRSSCIWTPARRSSRTRSPEKNWNIGATWVVVRFTATSPMLSQTAFFTSKAFTRATSRASEVRALWRGFMQRVEGCRCGLALARAGGKGWDRLCCSPVDTESPDALSWAPDSKALAFSIDHQIIVIDVGSRRTEDLARGDVPRWSPAGNTIAFLNEEGDSIIAVNVSSRRTERHRVPVRGIVATGLEWSPDDAFLPS